MINPNAQSDNMVPLPDLKSCEAERVKAALDVLKTKGVLVYSLLEEAMRLYSATGEGGGREASELGAETGL